MKITFTFLFFLLSFVKVHCQEEGSYYYKGNINKESATFYIKIEDPCGGEPRYSGMYKYDKTDNWTGLYGEINFENDKLHFIEYKFTGVFFLDLSTFNDIKGYWISPDVQQKLPVDIKLVPKLDKKQKEKLDEILERLYYIANDC